MGLRELCALICADNNFNVHLAGHHMVALVKSAKMAIDGQIVSGGPFIDSVCEWAAAYGGVVTFVYANNNYHTRERQYVLFCAGWSGCIDTMNAVIKSYEGIFLHNREEVTLWVGYGAAYSGNFHILTKNNIRYWIIDESTCTYSARGGHLKTLKLLRERGCPWNHYTLYYASTGGYTEMVEWARANGCPESIYYNV